jgi:hypothetical protein
MRILSAIARLLFSLPLSGRLCSGSGKRRTTDMGVTRNMRVTLALSEGSSNFQRRAWQRGSSVPAGLTGLPHPGQRMGEALSRAQPAFAVPTADVDGHAAFGRRSVHPCTSLKAPTPIKAKRCGCLPSQREGAPCESFSSQMARFTIGLSDAATLPGCPGS